MALKQLLGFALKVMGDGTDRTVSVVVATAPMGVVVPEAIGGHYEVTPGFSLASLVPTGITGLASANGKSVSATITLGVMAVTYAVDNALGDGEIDVLYGNFTF